MKKHYVVRVKSPSAWSEIHELLTTDGTLCDNVPSRCCECSDKKEYSKYRSTYLLDEEEAELLRSNNKVDYVELDPGFHMETYPRPKADALVNRFPQVLPSPSDPAPFAGYKIYRTLPPATDGPPISPAVPGQAEYFRSSWGLLRTQTKADPFSYTPLVASPNVDGFSLNRNFGGNVNISPSSFQYEEDEDGSDVDVLIIDDGVWMGHPEFVNVGIEVSLVRDLVLDGPYYIDPDYFISNGLVVTYLGRLTCNEQAARNWWRDSTNRSKQFESVGTIPSIDDGYTRAAVCGDFSNVPAATVADHGTPVASMAYGRTFGWAFNANKWTIAAQIGNSISYLINTPSVCFDITKIFHENKPLNPNRNNTRDPLVINNSYGYISTITDIGSYKFRTNAAASYTGIANAPNFLKGISSYDPDDRTFSYNLLADQSLRSSGDELLDDFQDIIFFASAGNYNQKQDVPSGPDYDNWFFAGTNTNPVETQKEYINRRGFPADAGGFTEQNGGYRTISVGALSSYKDINSKESKDYYSNAGKGVDIFSPGGDVLSALVGTGTGTKYERYDSDSFYSWLNVPAYDGTIDGTSSSSPVAAGFIASKLSKYRNWTTKIIKSYINNVVQKQDTVTDFELGADPFTENAIEWREFNNLFGQDPIILYNETVPDITISVNLPPTVTTNPFGNIVLSISPGINQFVDSYTYQWEKKLPGESEFSIIPGVFSAIYSEKINNIAQDGTEYRVLIIPNGPYNSVYSSVSTLSVTSYISIEAQSNDTSTILTTPFNLFVSAGVSVAGISLSYQWQKFNTITSLWEDLAEEIGASYFKDPSEEEDSGSYRCVVSSVDAFNSPVISNTIVLSVLPVFTITIITQPQPTRVDFGEAATFRVNAVTDSGGTLEYQWQRSFNDGQTWGSINSATQSILTLQNVTDQDSGLYRCVLFDELALNSTVISASAFLSVSKSTLSITNQPDNVSSFVAGSATFEVEASSSGAGAITYQWQKSVNSGQSWTNILNANGSILELFNINSSDEALYRCVVQDNISFNSPLRSLPARLTIFDVVLTITGSPIESISVIEGEELSISAGATLSDGRSPSFRWEKFNGSSWELVEINSSGVLTFPRIPLSSAGTYRCVIIDPGGLAQGSPFTTSSSVIEVTDSYEIKGVVDSAITASIGDEIGLGVVVEINNPILSYIYTWQKKEDGSTIWEDIPNSNSANYSFIASGADYLDTYRCKVDNVIGNIQFSDVITLTLNPFVDIIQQPPSKVDVRGDSNENQNITFEVASTSIQNVSYQWQISLNNSSWSDIEGKTDIELLLTPEDITSLSSNDYFLRCKVTFDINGDGSVLQEIFTASVFIDLKTNINLFGDVKCLNESQAFNLRRLNVDSDPILQNDLCGNQNTCGDSIDQLLEKYSFYNTQKGIFSSWGGIEFPWEISDQTPNIIFSQTDSRWSVARYRQFVAYFAGDRVLLIENDGFELSVYEAIQNILSTPGPFEFNLWKKVCSVKTTIPVGLPTIDFLKQTYSFYSIDYFYDEWGNIESTWSEAVYETSAQNCLNPLVFNAEEFEKCLKNSGTDSWNETRVRKEFFYRKGDFFLTEGECGDTVCLWEVLSDVPATIANYNQLINFSPKEFWRKLYCLKTGVNKCTSYNRQKTPEIGYDVVQIGSLGNFVEAPVPYRVTKQFEIEDLDKKKEPEPNPIILTPKQIFDLENDIYPYTTKSDT